jgi:hypothetical protein
MAEAAPITSRFFGIEQAARRLGNQETEYCLIEGTLSAWQREGFLQFEELDRFREGLLLRGVHPDHLDAVRVAVQGAPISRRCWRRWFAMGIVNLKTGTVVLQFPGYRHAVVFQPQVQSTDVLQLQARAAKKSSVVENRPTPPNPSPQAPPLTGITEAPPSTATVMDTKTWMIAEARQLKADGKITEDMPITEVAKVFARQMAEAVKTGTVKKALDYRSIRNQLARWGLWPISSIK